MAGWDVAILPFAHNESTRFISPTKDARISRGRQAGRIDIDHRCRSPVWNSEARPNCGYIPGFRECDRVGSNLRCATTLGWRARVDCMLAQNSWDLTHKRMCDLIESRILVKELEAARKPAVPVRRPISAAALGRLNVLDDYYERIAIIMFDYLVVGAGYAGSVIAERLARKFNKRVLICDRRNHIGGNAYDHYNEDGILVHKYGPHIFHTNSADVFEYLSQFTKWRNYEHRVLARVDGKLVPIPINLDTVNKLYNLNLDRRYIGRFLQLKGREEGTHPNVRRRCRRSGRP